MWSLLILMILVPYLLTRCLSEKSYDRAYEKKIQEGVEFEMMFFDSYSVSTSKTDKVIEMVNRNDPEIIPVANELFNVLGVVPSGMMIVYGYLALNGKIPGEFWVNRYGCLSQSPLSCGHNVCCWMDNFPDKNPLDLEPLRLKFLVWYNETLRNNGVVYELMLAKISKPQGKEHLRMYDKKNAVKISEWKDFDVSNGFIAYWEPISICTGSYVKI